MNWSKYQIDFFNEVENTNNHIILKATAGAGKTTSAVHAARLIEEKYPNANVCFMAFNKSIQQELERRLPEKFPSKTVNSFFYHYLRKGTGINWFRVDAKKYTKIAMGYTSTLYDENRLAYAAAARIANIIHFIRVTKTDLYDMNAVWSMIDTYGIQTNGVHPASIPDVFDMIQRIGIQFAINHQTVRTWVNCLKYKEKELATRILTGMGNTVVKQAWIDWDEQVYLPNKFNLIKPEYDIIIVDEAQDLSTLNRENVLKSLKQNGRLIAIGDPSQSIYGFSGADTNGMQELCNTLKVSFMPLSISYRCPRSHVELAQNIDSTVEWADNAIEGKINYLEFNEFIQYSKELSDSKSDVLGMGRKNVTIVRAALSLLANRIPITIKGRKFGDTLANIIKKIAYTDGGNLRSGFKFDSFDDHLSAWHNKEYSQLEKRNARESSKIMLNDKHDCLKILWESYIDEFSNSTIDDFIEFVSEFFNQENGSIVLSTVHRAKGLEADITFILNPNEMPLVIKGQSEEEKQQEMNIKFVALTRSKNELNFVTLPDIEESKQ